MSQPYAETMAMCLSVSYTPYDTSSRGGGGEIITSVKFEEVVLLSETQDLLSKTRDDAEVGNKSDDD